jgi:hypothetical protein
MEVSVAAARINSHRLWIVVHLESWLVSGIETRSDWFHIAAGFRVVENPLPGDVDYVPQQTLFDVIFLAAQLK